MKVRYNLLKIDVPNPFGSVLIPRRVVLDALEHFESLDRLELCRYEPEHQRTWEQDSMLSRFSDAGQLLEVIGSITRMWIEGDTLKCEGVMKDQIFWPLPKRDYTPIPYMDFKHRRLVDPRIPSCKRLITEAKFTEVVLVYQAVTRLALRKYQDRMRQDRS